MSFRYSIAAILLCFAFCTATFAQDITQQIVPGRQNDKSQFDKPYVILISADGFRHDLAEKYHAETLLKLAGSGVKADYLQPSYPSLTFPNHYTIATGMYPAHHGLVDNSMYDKKKNTKYSIGNRKEVTDSTWYGGEPIWVLAEKNHMLSASFYWVGSETAVEGYRPTYYYIYNDKIDITTRINEVKKWLQLPEDKRPHLITFYFPDVDHAEHKSGTESKETEEAVHFVDESIKAMTDSLATLNLPINYVFVADHGMTNVDTKNPIIMPPPSLDTNKFIFTYGSSIMHLYAKTGTDVEAEYQAIKKDAKDFDVYRTSTDVPAKWHYSHADDYYNRIGDMILVPHLPRVFGSGKRTPEIGNHGFDPYLTDMRATFYAWGPAFKKKKKIPGFENVDIYPMIAHLLDLKIEQKIDGNFETLKGILK